MCAQPKIQIFDTTLRDGEQSAGVAFTPEEKVQIAIQLERLGVDVIEAGFPCSTPGDYEAVSAVSRAVKTTTVCALARAVRSDVDSAWAAIRHAADPRIHVFINTSDIQIAHQLGKDRSQVLTQATEMIQHAARYTSNVEFSPMDATRSDRDFLCSIVEQGIAAGATVVNLRDSVGYATPSEVFEMFREVIERIPNSDQATFSFHGHNDLGLCTANTLSATQGGAGQVEVTINGIGERAGNTSVEEVVMAIETRQDQFGIGTGIDAREIYPASKLVERISSIPVQFNKAVVGRNAFRHGSGIHQDGILKLRETWKIMDPRRIGIPEGSQLVLGKLSGRHAFRAHVERMGMTPSDEVLQTAFEQFKALADRKMACDDGDLAGGPNFGCGSSREHAAWALQELGLEVIIAPSFADIFRTNCVSVGILPMVVATTTAATHGHEIRWIEESVGALQDGVLDRVREAGGILFGAVGDPRFDRPDPAVRPEQAILGLRAGLGLFANLRPVGTHNVDLLIVRELTGGIYFGEPRECTQGPEGRRAIDTCVYTDTEVARVVQLAFSVAPGRGRRVTSVDKANVLATSQL